MAIMIPWLINTMSVDQVNLQAAMQVQSFVRMVWLCYPGDAASEYCCGIYVLGIEPLKPCDITTQGRFVR
jgi:hypothetical protein